MEELNGIISAISSHTDVPRWGILKGDSPQTTTAHRYLCHIIVNCYPHLMGKLAVASGETSAKMRSEAQAMDRIIACVSEAKLVMNRIRRALSLPIIKVRHKGRSGYISNTKRLFGFDYTDEEIVRRHNAIREANQYMDRYCSVGRQPIDIGMVWTRVMPKRSYESWYNE